MIGSLDEAKEAAERIRSSERARHGRESRDALDLARYVLGLASARVVLPVLDSRESST